MHCNGFLGTIVASQWVAVAVVADEGLKLPRQLGGGGGGHGVNGSGSSDWDATCALRAHARPLLALHYIGLGIILADGSFHICQLAHNL